MWDLVKDLVNSLSPRQHEELKEGNLRFIYDEEKQRVLCLPTNAIPVMSSDITHPVQTVSTPEAVLNLPDYQLNIEYLDGGARLVRHSAAMTCTSVGPDYWGHMYSADIHVSDVVPWETLPSRNPELTPNQIQTHLMEYIENSFLSYVNRPEGVTIPNFLDIPVSRRSGKTELIKFMQAQNPDLNIGVVAHNSDAAQELRHRGLKNVVSLPTCSVYGTRGWPHRDIYFFDEILETPSQNLWGICADFAVRLYTPTHMDTPALSFRAEGRNLW